MDQQRIIDYYNQEIEKNRLSLDHFKLEAFRTKDIIKRFLPNQQLAIADVGGGAGYYAFWLQSLGHAVSLVDLSPKNILLAKQEADARGLELTAYHIGDARNLNFADNSFDRVLLLGPLYHLVQKEDRLRALSEAKRILKPGGIILAAVISRYASLIDGLKRDLINDVRFEKILLSDLHTGIHQNQTNNPEYFTTAFFHTPQEIRNEMIESGLELDSILAVEGIAMIIDEAWKKLEDQPYRATLEKILNITESNPDLLALSPHILAIARKL